MDPHDRDKRPSEQAIEKQDKTVQIRSCPSCGYSHTGAATICPHDGAHLRLVHEYSAHSFSGHYQLISEIGSGGMGLVYKAKHLALNRLVAIKMMHAHKLVGPGVRRFQQEAQAVSHLNIPI